MERAKNKVNCNDIGASFECFFCFFFAFVLGTTVRTGQFIIKIHILKVQEFPLQIRYLKSLFLDSYETDSS